MEPIAVKKIKVTVETTTDDGSVSKLVFSLDPYTFQMSQERGFTAVYAPLESGEWGKIVRYEEGLRGTRLTISGNVIKEDPKS